MGSSLTEALGEVRTLVDPPLNIRDTFSEGRPDPHMGLRAALLGSRRSIGGRSQIFR